MRLLETDNEFLSKKGYVFDVTDYGIIIHNFSLPSSYSDTNVDLLVLLPAGYPNAKLDMFWTIPRVTLKNGHLPKAAEAEGEYGGRTWQRWSRHWPTPWRPGIDGLGTFLAAVHQELEKGI